MSTLGLLAGLASVAIAAPLGHLAGLRMTLSHAALAVPVALGVVLLAGIVPAVRASRAHPAAALRPPGLRSPRARPPGLRARRARLPGLRSRRARRPGLRAHGPRSILGLAMANLGRLPGRTLLGAAGLAIGVAALTVLTALTWVFHGAVVGTVLGDAVAIRVRGVDTFAVVATVLLGVIAVADVLYLNIRDRAGELAALSATGWSPAALGRLVTYEGLGIGALGAVVGAGTGLGIVAALTGGITGRLWATGLATAAAGVLRAATAALVPALLTRRLPVARLLSEE